MPTRKASAVWEGGLKTGTGNYNVESGSATGEYSFARFAEGGNASNPEELLAAAEASCYSMAFSGALERNGTPPTRIATEAACTVEKVGEGFQITTMKLDVRATNQQGVYALQTPLPRGGTWVLSMTIKDGTAPATALITVDRRGLISKVDVPSSRSRDGWVVPRAATQKDVEAALAEGMLADSGERRGTLAGTAAVGLPLGVLLAIAALRRRRVGVSAGV